MSNEQKLKSVLSNVFGIEEALISEQTSTDTVEVWDSLHHLSVILAVEEEFNISFEEEESIIINSYPLIKTVLKDHGVEF